jgi:hypothetical protein
MRVPSEMGSTMSWFLVAAASWAVLSLVVGLLIGGSVAMEERSAGRQKQPTPPSSGQLGEGPLDGERAARALEVHEHRSSVG